MNVHDHLEAASRLPWLWGGGDDGFAGEDCTLFAANWALALTGRDPGAGVRGMYSTERGALAILGRAGGMEAFIDRQLRQTGWIRIGAEPRDGDIGVVNAPIHTDGRMGPTPAVRAGGLWVARAERGQVGYAFETLSVWRWHAGALADLGPPPPRRHHIVQSMAQQYSGSTHLTASPQMEQTGVIELYIFAGLVAAGVSAPAIWLTTALAYAVVAAVTIGAQLLLMPRPPKPEDGKAPKVQGIPHRILAIGTNRIGGAYMLWEEYDKILYAVLALAGHPISAINTIYLHDDIVERSGLVVQEQEDGRYGGNLIQIDTRLGAVPETAYSIVTDGLASEGMWTANHRGDGQASLAMVCKPAKQKDHQKRYPSNIPQPSVVLDGALMWDFRDDEQDPDDPATWTFSKNPVLAYYWFECFCPFGPRRDYQRVLLPVIEQEKIEADICDELVGLAAGGTQKRYEVNGWGTTETDPRAVRNSILAACDGWTCERGDGATLLIVGKFREELVGEVTDDDIAGYFLRNGVPFADDINRLVPKFTYPATDFTTTDTDFFEDQTEQMRAGRLLSREADYGWVQQWQQARRLGWRDWKRSQQRKSGALELRLSGVNAAYSRWVRVNSPLRAPRLNGLIIENRKARLSLQQGGFQMEFVRNPDDIEDYNPLLHDGMAPPVPVKPDQKAQISPANILVEAVASSGSVVLRVTMDRPIGVGDLIDPAFPVVRYRLKDAGEGTPGPWVEHEFPDPEIIPGSPPLMRVLTPPVPNDQLLQVEVAFVASSGSYSDWQPVPPAEVQSTADPVAPGAITDLVVTPDTGSALLEWTTPNSANFTAVNIRRNTANNEGTSVLVHTEYGAPSSADAWEDTGLDPDTYYYWLKSRNASGVESATSVASGAVVVT